MPQHCSVPGCNANSSRNKGLHYHSFPKDDARREEWRVKIRTAKKITRYSIVCSLHFTEDDYVSSAGDRRNILKDTALPSINLPLRSHDKVKAMSRRPNRWCLQCEADSGDDFTIGSNDEGSCTSLICPDVDDVCAFLTVSSEELERSPASPSPSMAMQQAHSVLSSSICDVAHVCVQTYISPRNQLIGGNLITKQQFKILCGYEKPQFKIILTVLDIGWEIACALSAEDQLFLILYKYRKNMDYCHIACEFDIPRYTVSSIFSNCTIALNEKLRKINFWQLGKPNVLGLYTTIIDCTEIPVENTNNAAVNQTTLSHYKNMTTFKALIAISEIDYIPMYCSKLYGGSASDRAVVEKCGFLNLLEEGDTILADKGFDISDILEKLKVVINLPPFKHGTQLEPSKVLLTRRIANRRIYVEHAIGFIKKFKILQDRMVVCMWHLATPIFQNLFYLTSLRRRRTKL